LNEDYGEQRVLMKNWKRFDLQRFAYNPSAYHTSNTPTHSSRMSRQDIEISKIPNQTQAKCGTGTDGSTVGPQSQFNEANASNLQNNCFTCPLKKRGAKPRSIDTTNSATKPCDDSKSNKHPSLKHTIEGSNVSDTEVESSFFELTSHKRVRTVAVPKTMGAKVSQLVYSYENKAHDGRNKAQDKQSLKNLHSNLDDQESNITGPTKRAVKQGYSIPSPPADTAKSSGSFAKPAPKSRSSQVSQSTALLMPEFANVQQVRSRTARYFQCDLCKIMTPYKFDLHISDTLRCGNPICRHVCCEKCVIDSVGEACEEQKWHVYEGGFNQWQHEKIMKGVVVGTEQATFTVGKYRVTWLDEDDDNSGQFLVTTQSRNSLL